MTAPLSSVSGTAKSVAESQMSDGPTVPGAGVSVSGAFLHPSPVLRVTDASPAELHVNATITAAASGDACERDGGSVAADAPKYHARADSLCKSAENLAGRSGVMKLRHMAYEARHTALAAELRGRG